MLDFKIFILSHNRPLLLNECINSFISFNFPTEKIIISDNSNIENQSKNRILAKSKSINFIKSNTNSLYDHFYSVLLKAECDLALIFHDDDLINIEFKKLTSYFDSFSQDNSLIALNFNGFLFFESKKIKKNKLWFSESKNLVINEKKLIYKYLDNDKGGIAPWCGYIYNIKIYKKEILSCLEKVNKNDLYFDAYFTINLTLKHKIIWNNQNIYLIRGHKDSISSNTLDSYKFFYNYAKKNIISFDKKSLNKYRYRNLLILLRRKRKKFSLQLYIFVYIFFNSKYLRKRILKKLYYKFLNNE